MAILLSVMLLIVPLQLCSAQAAGPASHCRLITLEPVDFKPLTLSPADQQQTFDLLSDKDLERTPRDYRQVSAIIRTDGISRVALVAVDILDREHVGPMVRLPRGQPAEVSVAVAEVAGRPVSMLRAIRLLVRGQPVVVEAVRVKCAVELLPQPDVVVQGAAMDDSTIQAALDSLGDRGGVVHIPAGTYTVRNSVTIPIDDVTIYGDGPGTILQGTWDGAKDLLVADGRRDIRITGLHLRSLTPEEYRSREAFASTRPEQRHPSSAIKNGIVLRDCHNCRVDHCQVELFGQVGIMAEGGDEILVDHCFVHGYFPYGAGYGIGARGTGTVYIEDNSVENHRHSITTYRGCERSHIRFNRLVKDPYVVPEWYDDAKSITYLSSYPMNAHPGCGWVCVHDNYMAMSTGLMWSAAEMRGNSGWLYRNVIRASTIGIMCRDGSDDVWAWDNHFISTTQQYGSSASGTVHFDAKPPDFAETPYPHALNRPGLWPGNRGRQMLSICPDSRFPGPADALVLTCANTSD